MSTLLEYLPVITYLSLTTLWALLLRTFNFSFHAVLVGVMFVLHAFIAFFDGGTEALIVVGVTAFVSIVLYMILIYFVGGKASGETLLVVPATLLLAPVPQGLPYLALGLVLIFVVSIFHMRKQLSLVKAIIQESIIRSGVGTMSTPDYSDLPNRNELTNEQKTITVIPFMLVAMIIGAAISFLT